MIISVRGTSSNRDIKSDLYFFKKRFTDVEQNANHKKKNYKNMKVHSGFLEQYSAIKFFIISNVFKMYWNQFCSGLPA